jgi:NADPH:quinone reductase-like Zn-dependent oxidoreductase/ketosteroid isomerase-like protein
MQALTPTDSTIEMREIGEPVAGPGEVVVAVEAFSINRGETFLLERPRPGWRPGKDVAGTVVQTTAGGPPVGTRVVAHPESGGWAERVAVGVDRLAVLPPGVPSRVAAALPLAGLTALRLTRASGPLASRRVLISGASGGVGHYFAELATAQGAAVTAVTATAERGEQLQAVTVRSIADAPGTYDVVIESVGGDRLAAAWSKLAPHGRLIWMGQASRTPPTIDFTDWSGGSSATLRRFDYEDSDVSIADDLATLVRLVDAGRLHPEIGLVAGWDRTPEVIAALVGRSVQGNAVLEIVPSAAPRDPRAVLARYLDALLAGDIDTIRDSFAEDAAWTMHGELPISGTYRGRDRIVDEFLTSAGALFEPGSQEFDFPTLLVDGDTVTLEWTVRARSASGDDYDNRYCGIFVVRDGRIAEVREYLDTEHARRVLFGAAAVM